MYPAEFTYHKAQSVQDALTVLAQNPDAKLLAGGHSLVPAMKLRLAQPPMLIDISSLDELRGIRTDGDRTVIGAMTTHAEIVGSGLPLLSEVAPLIGDPMVRHRGTVGGSLAHADPAADYPAAALALNAELVVHGAEGERRVPADEFFQGMFSTSVGPGELLTAVRIPSRVQASAYEKFAHPASRYAVVGLAVVRHTDGTVRAALTGAGEQAVRLGTLEERLNAGQAVGTGLISASDLIGDRFASAEYRAHLVDVLAARAAARL